MLASAKCSIVSLLSALIVVFSSLSMAHAGKVQAPLPWVSDTVKKPDTTVEALLKVEKYLNELRTLVADFRQVSPDGTLASGKLFMQKPGKMRWQYNPPTPVLMVSDGETLVYYDYELDQISYLSLEDSLASVLMRRNLRFASDEFRVINFRQGNGSVRFTILQTNKLDEGSLTLEMKTDPMRIEKIIVVDATGQRMYISLQNQVVDLMLDKELFVFDHPRKSRKRPRRH